jgi:hypothetical protein
MRLKIRSVAFESLIRLLLYSGQLVTLNLEFLRDSLNGFFFGDRICYLSQLI